MDARLYTGTSGWSYDHWKGVFYPQDLLASGRLEFYMEQFTTVEVNNTFYRLPSPDAFRAWRKAALERQSGFIYSLKASRFITHVKKLKDPKRPLRLFLRRAEILKDSLGPVLFQLPPGWRCNTERLEEFTGILPPGRRFAFEFRDASWFNEGVYGILRERGCAFCIYHMHELMSPLEVTAPFVYIRFHGFGTLYGGRYPRGELKRWAELIKGLLKEGKDVYAYFNNDAYGYAVLNAKELIEMAK